MSEYEDKIARLNRPEGRKEKEKYVRRVFDAIAPGYDLMNSLMSLGLHRYWRRCAVREMGVFPGARVLDGCAGTGDFALAAARVVGEKGRVAAFDFSSEMVKRARSKLAEAGMEGIVKLQRADATELPFADNSFDFATVGWGIRNLSHIEKGLSEIWRVLKPGGKFACLDLGRPVIPVYASVYYWCFFNLVPKLGKFVLGNEEAYAYLPTSMHTYPKQEELKRMMEGLDFTRVRYINLVGGAMAIHIGEKPQ